MLIELHIKKLLVMCNKLLTTKTIFGLAPRSVACGFDSNIRKGLTLATFFPSSGNFLKDNFRRENFCRK